MTSSRHLHRQPAGRDERGQTGLGMIGNSRVGGKIANRGVVNRGTKPLKWLNAQQAFVQRRSCLATVPFVTR